MRFSDYLDTFVPFPGFPGFPEQEFDPQQTIRFMSGMQSEASDHVLQLHGSGQLSNPCAALFGAARMAGYALPDHYWPNHEYFTAYPENEHEIIRSLQMLEFLGVPGAGTDLEFPVLQSDYEALRLVFDYQEQDYIVLHPGFVSGGRWPVEKFAFLADKMAANGLRIILTGSEAETELTQQVAILTRRPVVNLAGEIILLDWPPS